MEERFIELETKIAFQENTIDALNEVVTNQQSQIERLEAEIKAIKEQLANLADALPGGQMPEPPPPHY